MSIPRLAAKGANAKAPAKLPALQASRAADADVRKSIENIREWIEVRLGSRGDPYEKAVTLRELEQALAPLRALLTALGSFDGGIESLSAEELTSVPTWLRRGASVQVGDDLYYCNGKVWKQVTLV